MNERLYEITIRDGKYEGKVWLVPGQNGTDAWYRFRTANIVDTDSIPRDNFRCVEVPEVASGIRLLEI